MIQSESCQDAEVFGKCGALSLAREASIGSEKLRLKAIGQAVTPVDAVGQWLLHIMQFTILQSFLVRAIPTRSHHRI